MDVPVSAEAVIARIVSQSCKRRGDLDDEVSLYFSVPYRNVDWLFTIPQPLEEDGYTQAQLDVIEVQLARIGLELLPLDINMFLN